MNDRNAVIEQLASAIRSGQLTLPDFVRAFNRAHDAEKLAEQCRPLAVERYVEPADYDTEVDDVVMVSPGEDGVWVSAWVFVDNEQLDCAGVFNPAALLVD